MHSVIGDELELNYICNLAVPCGAVSCPLTEGSAPGDHEQVGSGLLTLISPSNFQEYLPRFCTRSVR